LATTTAGAAATRLSLPSQPLDRYIRGRAAVAGQQRYLPFLFVKDYKTASEAVYTTLFRYVKGVCVDGKLTNLDDYCATGKLGHGSVQVSEWHGCLSRVPVACLWALHTCFPSDWGWVVVRRLVCLSVIGPTGRCLVTTTTSRRVVCCRYSQMARGQVVKDQLARLVGVNLDEVYTFSVVRNPYDRQVSWFFWVRIRCSRTSSQHRLRGVTMASLRDRGLRSVGDAFVCMQK
jgi:hypothetical protein